MKPLSKKDRIPLAEYDADEYILGKGKVGERIVHEVQSELHIPEYSYRIKGLHKYRVGFFRKDIKSAIDFFLRYKDTEGYSRLEKEKPEIAKMSNRIKYETSYNTWLIKYCFRVCYS